MPRELLLEALSTPAENQAAGGSDVDGSGTDVATDGISSGRRRSSSRRSCEISTAMAAASSAPTPSAPALVLFLAAVVGLADAYVRALLLLTRELHAELFDEHHHGRRDGQGEERADDSHQRAAREEREEDDGGRKAQRPAVDPGNEHAALELLVREHEDEDDGGDGRARARAPRGTRAPTERSAPTYGSTSARPAKTASARAFSTPHAVRRTNVKTDMSRDVSIWPRMYAPTIVSRFIRIRESRTWCVRGTTAKRPPRSRSRSIMM